MVQCKQKHIDYLFVREKCDTDEWHVTYISTEYNDTYLLTKYLGGGAKRQRFMEILFIMSINQGDYVIVFAIFLTSWCDPIDENRVS